MVFIKDDSVKKHGLKKELIFLFFPVAFMIILLVRIFLQNLNGLWTKTIRSAKAYGLQKL